MKAFGVLALVALGSVSLAACDDDDEGPLPEGQLIGCDWFAGDNCWKSTVTTAQACVAPSAETGVLDAAGTSCTFTDGTEVVFHTPVPAGSGDYDPNLTIHKNDTACLTVVNGGDGSLTVTTLDGTFREWSVGSYAQISCPSGDKFHIKTFDAFDCNLGDFPGLMWSAGNGAAMVYLLGGAGDNLLLFTCEQP